jgi:hypothetical protein
MASPTAAIIFLVRRPCTMTRNEIISGFLNHRGQDERRIKRRWLSANAVVASLIATGVLAIAIASALETTTWSKVASATTNAAARSAGQ